ncbi:MAG: transporter substrate-binding domain-containing protein, partial [Bacteriovoracaceae bacterium]|nr:transporter substrate-binding domain-containing protein [Bacteriovoracaceae bacterium]
TSFEAVEGFKKAGIAIKDIKAFKGATEAFQALKAGQADVIVIDEAVGFYYAGLDAKTFIISGTAMKPEPIGIAVRKADKALHADLTKALATIKKNGTFNKIYKEWLKTEPTF